MGDYEKRLDRAMRELDEEICLKRAKMELKQVKLNASEIKMNDPELPIQWGSLDWSYGKEHMAQKAAENCALNPLTCLVGQLKEEWQIGQPGSLIISPGVIRAETLSDIFWISIQPFNYMETSGYKCPVCSGSVFYCASTGWKCDSCNQNHGRSYKPKFMLQKNPTVYELK